MTADLARRDGLLWAAQAHTHQLAGIPGVFLTSVTDDGDVEFTVHAHQFQAVAGALDLSVGRPDPYDGGIHWTARGVVAGENGRAIPVEVRSFAFNVEADVVAPDPAAADQFEAHQSGQFGSEVVPSWFRQ